MTAGDWIEYAAIAAVMWIARQICFPRKPRLPDLMPSPDMPAGVPWPPERPVAIGQPCGCVILLHPLDKVSCPQHAEVIPQP